MRLEAFTAKHLGQVDEMLHDPDVLAFTPVPEPIPDALAEQWLARYEDGRRRGTSEAFAVLDDGAVCVGLALVPRIDREAREVELGYIVAARFRRRGIGTQVLRALTEWAFVEEGALRVCLRINVGNHASIRVAQRAGFVFEGVMRSVHLKQGTRGDVGLWSRLPSDPDPRPA